MGALGLTLGSRNVGRPGGEEPEPAVSHFRGTGMTLGGDDTPSRVIEDPHAAANQPQQEPAVERILHFWRDGFSVDDGPLYRYDDPTNATTLEMINSGRAPLDLLNVQPNQPVDVKIDQHRDEDYKPPKKKYVPFSGTGQRLGSPAPAVLSAAAGQASAQIGSTSSSTSAPAASSSSSSSTGPTVTVDEGQPTVTVQIRLGDGTRLQSRFNTSHTVGDVYAFVDAASPASRQRPYVLMTTFPSKEVSERGLVLGEMSEFRRGGVLVQKWT